MFSDETTLCPTCGQSFKQIGHHFREKPNHRPTLDDDCLDVLAGILMGDGSITDQSSYPRLEIGITEPKYLTWLQREYPYLFTGIHREKRDGNHSDAYHMSTIPHPQLFEFKSWYRSGKKRFPANIDLSPKMVKHWYCCDGGLGWPGNSDAGASACLYSRNEEGDFLVDLLAEAGFDASDHSGSRIYICREDTPKFLGWMGPPPDGFEYKWHWQDKKRYKSLKERKTVTPEMVSGLSNQLVQVAGQLQQMTTVAEKQQRTEEIVQKVENRHDDEITNIKNEHQKEIEEVKERAKRKGAKEQRDELLRSVYEHPEVDVSQRILGECANITQQMVGTVIKRQQKNN